MLRTIDLQVLDTNIDMKSVKFVLKHIIILGCCVNSTH